MLSASKTFQNSQKSQKRSSEKVRRRTNSRSFRLNFVEVCLNVGILLPLPLLAEGLGRSLAFPLLPASTDGMSQAQHGSLPNLLTSLQNNSICHTYCKYSDDNDNVVVVLLSNSNYNQ